MLGGADSFIRCNVMENSGFIINFDMNNIEDVVI